MPTTTKGFRYPAGTDLISQGDDAIHNLASDVDGFAGWIPAGGASGAVLAKSSASDYALAWTPPHYVPAGGAAGQVLAKSAAADYALAWATPAAGGAGGYPPRGTTLPGAPADGDEYVYTADAAAGVEWHLKYRAGSASAYKWEFVGGSPLGAAVLTDEAITSSGAWVDTATVGPTLTLPLAGDYLLDAAALMWSPATGMAWLGVAVKIGAAATSSDEGGGSDMPQTAATLPFSIGRRGMLRPALAAATVLKLQAWAATRTDTRWRQRSLAVFPVRVG